MKENITDLESIWLERKKELAGNLEKAKELTECNNDVLDIMLELLDNTRMHKLQEYYDNNT